MKIDNVNKYFSFIKFSHTVFALPFALIGFFMGIDELGGKFDWLLFIYVLLCMVFGRNAAMGYNRYVDREIDKKNPRTAKREIPSGKIKDKHALLFVIINSLLFIATTFLINKLVFYLSPIALIVILAYSYTKRFTYLCHFVLGLGLSLAPVGAYLAVTGYFSIIPLLYSFIVFFWVSGFDIIYALQDENFDKLQKLKSIPVLLGKRGALILSLIVHFITTSLVVIAGFMADFGLWYWIGASTFIVLLFYQHTVVKVNDLSRVNYAFFTLNGIASVIFGVFNIVDILTALV